jgi:hypothetical protein
LASTSPSFLRRSRSAWYRETVRAIGRTVAVAIVPMLVLGAGRGAAAAPPVREREPAGCPRMKAACCMPGEEPCVRPGPARVLLLSLGTIAGLSAAAILFGLGDRDAKADAGTLLVGTGAVAFGGALLGMIAGRTMKDGPTLGDRVRRETLGLELRGQANSVVDERRPPLMTLRFGPSLWLDGGRSRIRLIGDVGGWLGATKQTDPRPQNDLGASGSDATRPVTMQQRRFALGLAVEFSTAVPYPAARRSAFLGRAELRWKPEVQYRREWVTLGNQGTRIVERSMLLPFTVGARWHLSQRQRFTFYVGPRFDVISYSDPRGKQLSRGRPVIGPIYAEAWYDIDVGFGEKPRRDGRPRRAHVTGLFSLGYVHARFDGRGVNFGPVIGFLGPVHVQWWTRVRPRGAKAAFQGGVGATIGNGVGISAFAGAVLPDLQTRRRKR